MSNSEESRGLGRREFLTGAALAAALAAGAGEIPPKVLKPYRWQDLTVDDFAAAVEDCRGVCVVPLGCLEKHGYQLPLGTDALVATEVCERAARMERAMVFPFSPFGHVYGVQHKRGTVALRAETLLAVLNDLCEELSRNGLKKIIILNDHGGNNPLLGHFLRDRLGARRDYAVYHLFKFQFVGDQQAEFLRRIGRTELPELGHADIVETAEMMAIDRTLVHMDRVVPEEARATHRLSALNKLGVRTSVDWYSDYPHQIAGDPRGATPELGEWLLDTWAANLAQVIRLVRDDRVTPALLDEYYTACTRPSR